MFDKVMTSQRGMMVFLRFVCLFSFCYAVVESRSYCEDGWWEIDNGIEHVYGLVVKKNATWETARRTCEDKRAYLVNLEIHPLRIIHLLNLFVKYDANNTEQFLDFWSGMHINEGRLMWDGTRLVIGPQDNWYAWDWEGYQPDSNMGSCASFKPGNMRSVTLNDCNTPLPYMCQKSANDLDIKQEDICPPGFLGNAFLPQCYQISEDLVHYDVAQRKCELDNNGILVQANTDISRKIVEKVTERVYTENEQNEASVRATSWLFNQEDLLRYQAFLPLPLTFSLNRKLYRNEAVFIRTPVDILNSQFQFNSRNSILSWNIQQYDILNEPYHVNVTIPERQRRQSGTTPVYNESGFTNSDFFNEGGFTTGDFYNETVDYDYIRRSTGYYQFELIKYLPPRYVTSVKRLVRYSETDLYIYVVYATLQKGVLQFREKGSLLSIEDSNSFNLLNDNYYIQSLEENTTSMLNEKPAAIGESTEYYKGQYEFIDISKNVTKLRYFVCPRNARQKTEEYEFSVLLSIAHHLNNIMSGDIFVPSSLRVFSTVNCGYLKTVVDGKQITFYPARGGRLGYSSERCYSGHSALATATCVGGYDDGVRWSDITLNEGCGAVPALNQSESTMSLKNMSQTNITPDNYLDVINNTVTLTDPAIDLTEADVIYTADIISNYLAFNASNKEQVLIHH